MFLLTFERNVVQICFALVHFLADDQITTNVEDSQDKNQVADEETEVSLRKQPILGHTSRLTRIQHLVAYRK